MEPLKLNDKKLFYSIGEVAKLFNVNASLIRFWEKEFKQISPQKAESGKRKFTEKDIRNIEIIYDLVKEKGFTLSGAKEELKSNRKSNSKLNKIELKLKQIKSTLAELLEAN
ncbi:MAG: MerR family transcriptional regulator [Flavobacteriales bacterium]